MDRMKNVLVPVDGSACATRAVRWVSSVLAGQPGARLHLLHVEAAMDTWEMRSHLGADDIARLQDSGASAVLDPVAAIVHEAGIAVETHAVLSRDVAATIAAQVVAQHCDAVVMGTRGLGLIETMLLGSTTLKVIHLVDVPITLIK